MFQIKKALCETHEFIRVIEDLENKWVSSFLLRQGIPQMMLDRRVKGLISNKNWREYLFSIGGLAIYRHLGNESIELCKFNNVTQEEQVVGHWQKPEVVRIKNANKYHCEIRLKEWQII